jgi:hypothetical protein
MHSPFLIRARAYVVHLLSASGVVAAFLAVAELLDEAPDERVVFGVKVVGSPWDLERFGLYLIQLYAEPCPSCHELDEGGRSGRCQNLLVPPHTESRLDAGGCSSSSDAMALNLIGEINVRRNQP